MNEPKNTKTTVAGTAAGIIIGFGQPIINMIQGLPADFKLRDLLLAIALGTFGKLAADSASKKGG